MMTTRPLHCVIKKAVMTAGAVCAVMSASAKQPNILLISLDDAGYAQLSCYNPEQVKTPHIDEIAANGVRFTQAYATAPHCSPSRAGAMTGRYQTRFGHEDNHMGPGGGMPLSETTIDPAWALDGVDLMPFLTAKAEGVPHETLFWRFEGMWAVRSGDWKLMLARADDKALRLFNLAEDIGEKKNLASVFPERVQKLQKQWNSWNAEQMPPRAEFGRDGKGVWLWDVK